MLVSRGFLELRRLTRKYESGGVVHALFWTPDRDIKLLRSSEANSQPSFTVSSDSTTTTGSENIQLQVRGDSNVRKLHTSCSNILAGIDD